MKIMSDAGDVFSQALDLPDSQRADLAYRLMLSLEPAELEDQAEDRWAAEIAARQELIRRGDYTAYDWQETVHRIRTRLAERKPS